MLCGVITNSDHVVHFLAGKLIYRFRTVTRDVNANLPHYGDCVWPNVAGVQTGAEDFEAIAGLVSQKSFSHLAARDVACANYEYFLFLH